VLFGAVQSVLAGLVVLPMVSLIPAARSRWRSRAWPLLVAVAVLSRCCPGALGLALGTYVNPRQIGLMFSVVVLPLTFLGAVYYPWSRWRRCPGCSRGAPQPARLRQRGPACGAHAERADDAFLERVHDGPPSWR
jgi:ABC-2 type transport system permease protein